MDKMKINFYSDLVLNKELNGMKFKENSIMFTKLMNEEQKYCNRWKMEHIKEMKEAKYVRIDVERRWEMRRALQSN